MDDHTLILAILKVLFDSSGAANGDAITKHLRTLDPNAHLRQSKILQFMDDCRLIGKGAGDDVWGLLKGGRKFYKEYNQESA